MPKVFSARTAKRTLYLLASLPLGVGYFTVLVTGLSVGLGTAITLVGLPILVGMLFVWRGMAMLERRLVGSLLQREIPESYRTSAEPGWWPRTRTRIADPATWKDLAYLMVHFPLSIAYFTIATTLIAVGPGLLLAPAWYWAVPDGIQLGLFTVDTLPLALAVAPLGALLTFLGAYALDGLGTLHAGLARLLLGNDPDPELTQRVDDLRDSRQRIIAAGDDERRRLERDLHDGAQQRLVALSLKLGMAKARLTNDGADDAAAALVTEAHEESRLALAELRDLARGIHPSILTDRGLAAALEDLAGRAPIPVSVTVPEQRLPGSVEAAAYFVVAEALANVAKYAQASSAVVEVRVEGDRLVVEVSDDGVGGADPQTGSGLRGLADRVGALDGTLHVESPAGLGTALRAELPLAAAGPTPAG